MQASTNIKKIRLFEAPSDILYLKYINQKKSIAAGFMDGSVILYNSRNLNKEIHLYDSQTKSINNATTSITFSNKYNDLITCSYSGGLIKIWNYLTGECVKTISEKRQICGVIHHPTKQKLFSYGDDGNIILYDTTTEKKEFVYQKSERNLLDGHTSKIFTLVFNSNAPNEFVTGGWDYTLYYWDVRCQHAIRKISNIFMCGDGIAISKNGKELVTCEWKREDAIHLWDYGSAQLINVVKPDSDICYLYCGKFLADNMVAVGGGDEHMFRIINLKSNSVRNLYFYMQTTISYIKDLASAVYSLDTMEFKKNAGNMFDDLNDLPVVSFSSGKTFYEIRYR